ncbi:spore coat protein [Ornithinibacillus halophilus]|uniref:Similar to spore coat protein n=1 Tax=Ornithinibacillus halophilus TaxID=930117 RepID=A0A1M5F411_9BACI|nr:spore coat protein [Ornithinibacillus halophilus]SHF86279.1 similar to spore coat protein [Ornithinibacillus halophilus]
MNKFIEKLTGMTDLTDQVIATDILIAAKSEVRNYALAITETASPAVRETLTKQLDEAIDFHEQMTNYMIDNGYYYPNDTKKQLELNLKTADTALNLANN